jgi:hypothetical protein
MNIPDVVNVRSDALYGDLLQVDNWVVTYLTLEECENFLSLARCRFHRPGLLHLMIPTVETLLFVRMTSHRLSLYPGHVHARSAPRCG